MMKTKVSLILFLSGLVGGLVLSPWADTKPQAAFLSPVAISLAEEPFDPTRGQVLGAETQVEDENKREIMTALIAQQDRDLERKPKETSLDRSGENSVISAVSAKVTLAVYGDSMVDTMGTGLPYLEMVLKKHYPNVQFTLLNYGIGAQNIETALARFNQPYSYKDRNYSSPLSSGADIIILESFAYNPMGDDGLNKQWLALSQMVEEAKRAEAQVMLLTTISPSQSQFGKGPGGINWDEDLAWQHAALIKKYLENAAALGRSLGIPVIDAFHASQLTDGEGNLVYISSHDHIHPSKAGHQFVANLIAQKIVQLGLIK